MPVMTQDKHGWIVESCHLCGKPARAGTTCHVLRRRKPVAGSRPQGTPHASRVVSKHVLELRLDARGFQFRLRELRRRQHPYHHQITRNSTHD